MKILNCTPPWLLVLVIFQAGCSNLSGTQQPAPVYDRMKLKQEENQHSRQDQKQYTQGQNQESNRTADYPEQTNAAKASPIHEHSTVEIIQPSNIALINPVSPVVIALLSEADQNYKDGNLELAVSTIERALIIEPRNARLVYKLAALRLTQNKPVMAENMAKKSALLAADDLLLKRHSWLLIAEARRLQGDNYGAKEARKKAERFY